MRISLCITRPERRRTNNARYAKRTLVRRPLQALVNGVVIDYRFLSQVRSYLLPVGHMPRARARGKLLDHAVKRGQGENHPSTDASTLCQPQSDFSRSFESSSVVCFSIRKFNAALTRAAAAICNMEQKRHRRVECSGVVSCSGEFT